MRSKKYVVIFLMVVTLAAGIAFGVLQYTKTIPSVVNIISTYGLEVYESDNSTLCTSIDFGDLTRGASAFYDVIVKNVGDENFDYLSLSTNLPIDIGQVTWNYTGVPLLVGTSLPIRLTLTSNSTATSGPYNFDIYINGETI